MSLWPRTLLWRTVLLIALLLAVASIAWLQIFLLTERAPRARQTAQQLVSVVNLTRTALITAEPTKRFDLLRELSRREAVQVYIADPDEIVPPLPDRMFLRVFATTLREALGADTQIALSRQGVRGIWVSFTIDEDQYWVHMPRSRIERNESLRWVWWGALVLALALAGAYLIVARINRPLRELTRAAGQMGQGATPSPIDEKGPAEIRTVSHAFNQLAADLKRMDDERALLLAGVSHDLRTPLSRIRLGLEMLDHHVEPGLREGIIEDIEEIDSMINQFLDFARLRNPESVVSGGDLNAIVREIAERYTRMGRDVQFTLQPLPPMALRPLAMQRLLANLIENALRHGGSRVEVRAETVAGAVRIEVLDRGPGIPPDQTERMLQPFTRLDAARGGTGTGLGLAIADRIARMHGGTLQLLAREGGGLCARVELPLDKSAGSTT